MPFYRFLLPLILLLSFGPSALAQNKDLLLVFDASGSMWGQVEGENKMVIARRVRGILATQLADDAKVGLIAYGHRREGDCSDIETLLSIGPLDHGALTGTVDAINPKGRTPVTDSIERAVAAVRERGSGRRWPLS